VRAPVREEVLVPGPAQLQALLDLPQQPVRGGVVVAHPHPLYGGTMVQPVVFHLARACVRAGWAALRFNFRGVEASEGSYHGTEERFDVIAAADLLEQRIGSEVPLVLAGYSFGSVMAALAVAEGRHADALVLVAFVVTWEEFSPHWVDPLRDFAGPVLAVCGGRDELAPPHAVRAFLDDLGVRYELAVVPEADHFFAGRHQQVAEPVVRFLTEQVTAPH